MVHISGQVEGGLTLESKDPGFDHHILFGTYGGRYVPGVTSKT